MVKRKPTSSDAAKPAWQTKWPRTDDLKTWLRSMVTKCDAIADDSLAADKAHLPLQHLAEVRETKEALKGVDHFLRRLPQETVLRRVQLAKLGAEIALNANDLKLMDKYLAIALATEPYNKRKCDKGFSVNSVRQFRIQHGLLDPADGADEKEQTEARFTLAERQFRLAMAAGDHEAAAGHAAELERSATLPKDAWRRRLNLGRVVRAYAELRDAKEVRRCIGRLSKAEREEVLDAHTLIELGMTKDGVARAEQTIKAELAELATSGDPNIHFPVGSICSMLTLLVEQGEQESAGRWLQKIFRGMPKWPVYQNGWVTSAVYTQLAEVAALLEGQESAMQLLEHALGDAKSEKHRDFGKGAVAAAIKMKANVGALDDAIADARKIRSPTSRRKELGRLLARAKRWKELAEVLSEVASPEEAAEVSWWIKFELPGG